VLELQQEDLEDDALFGRQLQNSAGYARHMLPVIDAREAPRSQLGQGLRSAALPQSLQTCAWAGSPAASLAIFYPLWLSKL
jgi:hypothetical protein